MPAGPDQPGEEQEALLPGLARVSARESGEKARRARASTAAAEPAAVDPVARVLVDVPPAHLDRAFDYAVPATMDEAARPGVRVKVRFAGQEVHGYLLERSAETDHAGRLTPLRRVVSDEAVLTPAVAELTRLVAERYAGTRSDVLRLAVPPRHATAEKKPSPPVPDTADPVVAPASEGWAAYPTGGAWLRHLGEGGAARAVWAAAPGEDWPRRLAEAAAATLASGRGAILCVPDVRDVGRVDAALTAVLGPGRHVALTADAGPARRYRDFLALLRGARRVVVGTRSAAFAPVAGLGLVAVWDDGDDLHAEPRAPYPHARETLLLRAEAEGTAALLGGFGRTVEAQQLLESGWAREVAPTRAEARRRLLVGVAGGAPSDRDPLARAARVPGEAHRMLREALETGPVLVQTPRSGYAASLACERCRTPARCPACTGPLRQRAAGEPPACGWCGTAAPQWSCAECGHRGLRAPVVGESRTAEELGRAFAPVPVLRSGGDHVLAAVADRPALVVATPGAEPVADGGYAGVLLLDTWLALARPGLRTAEEALRRWANAAGLARPGGRALAVGDPAQPALQALVRWDPAGFARREAEERRAAHLPPASRLATITGEPDAVAAAVALLEPPAGTEVLGPAPVDGSDEVRAVVRSPRSAGLELSRTLGTMQRARSARKLAAVRVQVDPVVL